MVCSDLSQGSNFQSQCNIPWQQQDSDWALGINAGDSGGWQDSYLASCLMPQSEDMSSINRSRQCVRSVVQHKPPVARRRESAAKISDPWRSPPRPEWSITYFRIVTADGGLVQWRGHRKSCPLDMGGCEPLSCMGQPLQEIPHWGTIFRCGVTGGGSVTTTRRIACSYIEAWFSRLFEVSLQRLFSTMPTESWLDSQQRQGVDTALMTSFVDSTLTNGSWYLHVLSKWDA